MKVDCLYMPLSIVQGSATARSELLRPSCLVSPSRYASLSQVGDVMNGSLLSSYVEEEGSLPEQELSSRSRDSAVGRRRCVFRRDRLEDPELNEFSPTSCRLSERL